MPFHMMAFSESVDLSTRGNLTPAPPASLETFGAISGDNFTLNRSTTVIAAMLLSESAADVVDWRFHKKNDPNWLHFNVGVGDVGNPDARPILGMNYPVAVNEILEAQANNAAAKLETVALALGSPGQISPIPLPFNKVVEAVGGGTLTADNWTNAGSITWSETFEPTRRYQIVGMAYLGASGHVARLVLPGTDIKPGCFGCSVNPEDNGGITWGDLGSFIGTSPPTFECLADTADTAETFTLFLR